MQKQENRIHNGEKYQSTKTNPKMTQTELVDIDIKPIITIFHMFKDLEKRQSRKNIDMEVLYKTISRDEAIISGMKNTVGGIKSRINIVEEKINKFGDITTDYSK